MRRRRFLRDSLMWTVSAGVTALSATRAKAQTGAASLSEADRAAAAGVVNAFRSKYAVPGLALAIARGGNLVFDEAFGSADERERDALTPAHRFRIASVTKPITSCAIMSLAEQGLLSLDARVFGPGSVLGTRFGRRPYHQYVEDISIAHLLTHTAGGWQNDRTDPMFRNARMDHAELISWTLDTLPLANPPGRAHAYSNFGYCVLGRVIEAVTGRPYADEIDHRVLAPCGVRRMAIAGNTLKDRASDEVVYHGQAGENPYTMNVRRMDSHGGWLASASDLVRFATHVDGFAPPPDILRSDTLRTMTSATLANPNYAKGWNVNSVNNWWHNGSLPGSATILVRTSSGLCWAALANTRRPGSDMDRALDQMVWNVVRGGSAWR